MPSMDRGTFSSSSRAELIEIGRKLYEEALVRREDELITDPRGQPIGWLLDTRVPTLDGELFTEVGSVIAERLRERGARQVVGYGFGAHPLVCSVLAVSEGDEFKGGLIREERKEHGRRRLVEGPIDADQPVVMVDDIINSGRSASEALRLVRSAGFAVDGLLTLFNFTWSNGQDRIEAEGLWVDSLLDLNLQEGTGSGSDSA
ncbi:orotate phosphoribosyltransferase [Salinibacter ruber]|jgi:orotate phosphoribosyltransferase|uniref:Orotate phosphoribosyltransferase n=3 Tax=Salinibacteraceae TaxID=1853225 RepID=A0A9X2R498_9BACT|nr:MULTISPECIES: orotate phosphoribosyltransferase [Salinibacter]CBH23876.1 Orotate phosphoribosyltransferase [Salinibacter ruber M8]MBB4061957.1 orotate phosphoribosyltransferase [Salinibacter ruber]MBB4067619.1 orotate phosphoribosyltransferase [Salinibacter ruber]MCS3628644.1 orotate phosphoribosyltransferase [Salinibacter ruber]MCS3631468.1 orotate phosphoribosyltransferase [Salinibacter ruber]